MNWKKHILNVLFFVALPNIVMAGPSYDVYTDSYSSMWGSWSWGVTATPTSTRAFRGSASMQVTYGAAWTAFAPGAWHDNGSGGNLGFQTAGYKHITFAVYNTSNGNNLWFNAYSLSGAVSTSLSLNAYTATGSIPVGKWTWVRIPISAWNLGSSPTIQYFAISSGISGAIVNFDDITFGASTTFYEGIQVEKGPGVTMYNWNSNVSQPSSSGDYWLQIVPTSAWGGIQLQVGNPVGIVSSDYGSLTVLYNKSVSNQTINVSLVNANNAVVGSVALNDSYLPNTLQPSVANKWYRVNIPLSHFFSGTINLGGVAIETNLANTFSIDDVRLVQKLAYPIPTVTKSVSGFYFGQTWLTNCSNGVTKLHNGIDYFDNANQGRAIHAASRGYVKQVTSQPGGWGYAIVIQHETGFTTNYLHLNQPSLVAGDEVQRGQQIGTTTTLASGSHLHFGMRITEFDATNSQTGALGPTACDGWPAFPAAFINPESMDWQ